MANHGDALDFDLFDRWRVRLRDVPSTIGWGVVALFLRHVPADSEVMREMRPYAKWSVETHMIANVADMLGNLFAKDYEPIARPGEVAAFSTAVPVDPMSYEAKLARFRKEASDA